MKVAALDLGSNTCLCLIAEVQSAKITKIYADEVRIVRLGEGLGKAAPGARQFTAAALSRAEQALTEFAALIQKHKPDRVLAMATAAARDVGNAKDLIAMGAKLGIPIEIIPGEKEAQITFSGATSGQTSSSAAQMVVDVGGGSTEIIIGEAGKILFAHSLNIGCVKLTERFLAQQPPTSTAVQALTIFIEDEVRSLKVPSLNLSGMTGLAVAGTPTELARVEIGGAFDAAKIDGFALTLQSLKNWREKFATRTGPQIAKEFSLDPGRADVILVGVLILIAVCERFNLTQLQVSTRGVRYGVALELASRTK